MAATTQNSDNIPPSIGPARKHDSGQGDRQPVEFFKRPWKTTAAKAQCERPARN